MNKLFAGYNGFLEIFDIEKPLYQTYRIPLKDSTGSKSIKTLVSAISCDIMNPNVFAYGCYDKRIALADLRASHSAQFSFYVNHLR